MDVGGFFNREIPAFKLALQFLTRLPVTVAFSDTAMRQSPRWYPAVGLVVGAVAGLVFVLGNLLLTAQLAVFLAVAAAVIVTGALHEDGFADACDGLGGVRPKERVLEIMRDSRIGAYGVIGLIFMIGTKGLALSAMPATDVFLVLIAGHTASRAAMVWVMASSDYVREKGAGSAVAGGIDRAALIVALITTGLALLPLVFCMRLEAIFCGLVGLVLAHYLMRRWYEPRLGGYTGDCLGAVQQCSEVGFYLGLLVVIGA